MVIVQFLRFSSQLSDAEVRRAIDKRSAQYQALPGLLQKLYVHNRAKTDYGGIYLWKDKDTVEDFCRSELAPTIPDVHRIAEPPCIEAPDVISILRPDAVFAITS